MKKQTKQNTYMLASPLLREMQILELLEVNPHITQAALAKQVGLAVAMVNTYISRFAEDGYIEKVAYSDKAFDYVVTNKGRQRIHYHFLSFTSELILLYSMAKERVLYQVSNLLPTGELKVVLYGAGEVAEVLFNTLKEVSRIKITGIIDDDPDRQGGFFYHLPVSGIEEIKNINPDAIIISAWNYSSRIAERVKEIYQERYYVVSISERFFWPRERDVT